MSSNAVSTVTGNMSSFVVPVVTDQAYEFTTTQKGGRALLDTIYGFQYNFVKESGIKMTFVCKSRSKTKCPAFAYIMKHDMSAVWPDNHNHGQLHSATKSLEKQIIKEQASSGDTATRIILQNIVSSVVANTDTSLTLMSSKESLERRIRYSKQKAEGRPGAPKDYQEMKMSLELHDSMTTTKDGGVFFREMTEIGDLETKQYVLFMSDTGKEILQRQRMWAGDGTFSSAPKLFMQVYFVGGVTKDGVFLPAAFMLLPGKTEEMYRKVFETIVDIVGDVSHVTSFSGDFEQGVINVVEDLFPNVSYNGCYFHYKQSIFRNLQLTKSLPVLQHVSEFEKAVNFIYALPFVPSQDIVMIYEKVIFPVVKKAEDQWTSNLYDDDYKNEVNTFMTRMENSWVGKSIRRGRRAPLHAVDTWNYFEAMCKLTKESADTNICLTNNMVEGLNSTFAPNVPRNASVWSVIRCFQKEEMITRLKYTDTLTCEEVTHNRKRKKENMDRMYTLADICRTYAQYTDKTQYMEILVRHWGKGKDTAAKE